MRHPIKLFFVATGFLCLCLCGVAFAAPSFDRFDVALRNETPAAPWIELREIRPYISTGGDNTPESPDTWKLAYVPAASGIVAFYLGGEGSDFTPGTACSVDFALSPLRTEPLIHADFVVSADGTFRCKAASRPPLTIRGERAFDPAAAGVLELSVTGTIETEREGESAARWLRVVLVPARPDLNLSPEENGDAAKDAYVLPAGTTSLRLRADLDATIAGTLTWRDADSPATPAFERESDAVPFGTPFSKTRTVSFRNTQPGATARIEVSMPDAPDGSGGTEPLTRLLTVRFANVGTALTLSPAALSGTAGSAFAGTVEVRTPEETNVVSGLKVVPSEWNGIAATPAENGIRLSGVPAAKDSAVFTATALVNGVPRTATFVLSIADGASALKLPRPKIEGRAGLPLSETIAVSGSESSDVVGPISVAPSAWNSVSASVSGGSVVLRGTPALPGDGRFTVSAPVNGVPRSADLLLSVAPDANSPLNLSPAALEATAGRNLTATITTFSEASGDVVARVAVSPANWNGLAALVSDTKILLGGIPSAAGTQVFAVTAVVNGKACSSAFAVSVAGGSAERTTLVSVSPESWSLRGSGADFTLTTALTPPSDSQKTLLSATASAASAAFRYNAVQSAQAVVSGETLTIRGTLKPDVKPDDAILDKISVTFADGAVYEQDNLNLPLPQVAKADSTTIGADVSVSGSSGCNGGFGVLSAVLLPFFLPRRKKVPPGYKAAR